MKKYFITIIPISLIILSACSTSPKIKKANIVKNEIKLDNSSWSNYSYGLYHKNFALKSSNYKIKKNNLLKAITYFEKSIKESNSFDKIYFQIADTYLFLNNYNKSLEYALKSLKINKKFYPAYHIIFSNYITLRKNQEAADILEKYISISPDSERVNLILANHYSKKLKNTKKAKEKYKRIIQLSKYKSIDPYYLIHAYYSIGYFHFKENKYDKAITSFMEVNKIAPDNLNSIYMLTLLYMSEYDLGNAQKYAANYLDKNPADKFINSIMGRVLYLKNSPDALFYFSKVKETKTYEGVLASGLYNEIIDNNAKADTILASVMKFNFKYISALLGQSKIALKNKNKNLAINKFSETGILAFSKKLYSVAEYCFLKIKKLDSENSTAPYYLGRIAEIKKQYSTAIMYYKISLKKNPDPEYLMHIAYLYGVDKKYTQSLKYFDLAIDKNPKNSKAYFLKGLIYIWQENYIKAENIIKKAIEFKDNDEGYYFYLALSLEKQKKREEAIKSLELAIKYNSESARTLNFLGYLYAEENIKIEESFRLIKKALKYEPDNGAFLDSLGWVYFRKGNYKLALKNLLLAEKNLNQINSPDYTVFDHIGDTFLKIGKEDKAIIYWGKALKINKDKIIQNKINNILKK